MLKKLFHSLLLGVEHLCNRPLPYHYPKTFQTTSSSLVALVERTSLPPDIISDDTISTSSLLLKKNADEFVKPSTRLID